MDKDELERRVNANLKPLDVKSASEVADSAFKAPQTKSVLEKVQTKADPELAPTISPIEAFWAQLVGYWKGQATNQFEGKPTENPLAPFSFVALNWKWLLIGLAVLGIIGLVLWLVL